MADSKTMKRRRRNIRETALKTIQGLSDDELRNLRHELGRQASIHSAQLNEVRIRLDAVKGEIERRRTSTPAGIHITDHAIVRYLERVKGMDIDGVRNEIGDMAAQARRERDGDRGRRRHDGKGVVIGIDETRSYITTIFSEDELPVMEFVERP